MPTFELIPIHECVCITIVHSNGEWTPNTKRSINVLCARTLQDHNSTPASLEHRYWVDLQPQMVDILTLLRDTTIVITLY